MKIQPQRDVMCGGSGGYEWYIITNKKQSTFVTKKKKRKNIFSIFKKVK